MQPIKRVGSVVAIVVVCLFFGCSTASQHHNEARFFKSWIERSDEGKVHFFLQNVSNERLAVLTWNVPFADQELQRELFEVSQAGRLVPYRGKIIEYAFDGRSIVFMDPGQIEKSLVEVKSSYSVQGAQSYVVRYNSCIQFRIVRSKMFRGSIDDLDKIECLTSNALELR